MSIPAAVGDSQGSYRPWKVLESPGILLFRIPGPGKSWKKA